MPWRRALVIVPLAVLVTSVMAGASSEEAVSSTPKIVLDSRLERIFVVSACKWISGLTCRITYDDEDVLPSRSSSRNGMSRARSSEPR